MAFAIEAAHGAPLGNPRQYTAADRLAAFVALAALAIWVLPHVSPAWDHALEAALDEKEGKAETDTAPARQEPQGREYVLGAYGGVSYTHPSELRIVNRGKTDMTMRDFEWIGRPFKSPIYYGLRTQRWLPGAVFGAMVDFTHAKAIAPFETEASFTGTTDGKPLPSRAKVGAVFKHLEFSHGHNILTLNGLFRMPLFWMGLRPYFGVGGGVSLPHTEVGLREETARTYEYQYAGVVGQLLAGVEVRLGPATMFFEYKFTYAPYDVPLSHEPYGWIFVTDVWRQFRAWTAGEHPPGGRLRTTLATQHGIAGLLHRVATGRIAPEF
jgi:hypothetical protein